LTYIKLIYIMFNYTYYRSGMVYSQAPTIINCTIIFGNGEGGGNRLAIYLAIEYIGERSLND